MELLYVYNYERAVRRERVFRDHLDPFYVSDEHLLRYYRFPRLEIIDLIGKLEPDLKRKTNRSHSISVNTQVLVALRFYVSGTFQNVVGDSTGLSQSSVSRVITSVTACLSVLAGTDIRMPNSALQINKTKQKFGEINGFPHVIGAIDGTHIPIKAPSEDKPVYGSSGKNNSLSEPSSPTS